jgi:hypothetical protein
LFVGATFNPATFGTCPAGATVEHGFLTDWVNATTTLNAQQDIAGFVTADTNPLSVRN